MIQQEDPGRVVATANLLGNVADRHPLPAELADLLALGGCQFARPRAHTSFSQEAKESRF